MKLRTTATLLAAALLLAGCPDDSNTSDDTATTDTVADTSEDVGDDVLADTVTVDDTVPLDTTTEDTAEPDVDVVEDTAVTDTAVADTATPGERETEWGTILGTSCGAVVDELDEATPSFLTSTYEIDVAEFDTDLLATGPAYRFDQPNAGGSSKCSEVMSLQWLVECEGAELYKIETAIDYDVEGAITDYEVEIDGQKVGVSVTRAYLGPVVTDYDTDKATTLLEKKLEGVNESTANVSEEDRWVKQILYIWTLHEDWVPILEQAWDALSADLKADTIIVVTVESGTDYIVTDTCDDAQ